LHDRQLVLTDDRLNTPFKTENKTIMQHTIDYTRQNAKQNEVLKAINWVRLYLKLLLPCKLVGKNVIIETNTFLYNQPSMIEWNFDFISVNKPNNKSLDE
jgi:hypothetical protein